MEILKILMIVIGTGLLTSFEPITLSHMVGLLLVVVASYNNEP